MARPDTLVAAGSEDDGQDYSSHSEATPFIPAAAENHENTRIHVQDDDDNDQDPRERLRFPVVALTFSIVFMLELGLGVSWPAWNALLEQGLCGEVYPEVAGLLLVAGADEDNPLCKDPTVQGMLAMYRGWTYTLEALPTILLAVFYGGLSDKWGRKPVGMLCVLGIILTTVWYEVVFFLGMPMWTTLLDGIFFFIGGGVPVGVSMLYTMLADVVHVDEMASVLFRFNSVFLVGELVSNPLGGYLLGISPWLSLVTGNVCMALAFSAFYFLPETLVVRRWHDAKAGRLVVPKDDDDDSLHPFDGAGLMDMFKQSKNNKKRGGMARRIVRAARAQMREIWDFLVTNKRVAFLILPFVCVSLGKYIQELLLQYATKRYGWSWSKASYFLTLKSASFIIMLTLVLPALSTHCRTRLGMSPLSKDLWLGRWSGVALVLADLVITLSASPFLFGCGLVLLSGGCGLTPLLRSLLNALVEPHHVGILNTVVGFLETLGIMVAAPVFSWGLQVGIEMGGGWIGLPFAAGTLITCASTVMVFAYRIPRELERDIVEEDHVA